MKLENGYKVVYGTKINELYVAKTLPGIEGKKLVFKDAEGQEIDLTKFKTIYSDDEYFYGSLKEYAEGKEKDVKFVVEDEEGNLVAGVKIVKESENKKEVKEEVVEKEAPEEKVEENEEEVVEEEAAE